MPDRPDTHGQRPSGLHHHRGVRAVAWSVIVAAVALGAQAAWNRTGLSDLVSLSAVAPVEVPVGAGLVPGANGPVATLAIAAPRSSPAVIENRIASVPASPEPAAGAGAVRPLAYGNRPLRQARTMTMVVTAYCPGKCCCGKFADGITASGMSIYTNGMKLVAADTRVLPMKTVIAVPGYNGGRPVPVLDRGGAIKGHRLDLLMPSHAIAKAWGKRTLTVTVYEYAD
ncbi:MAG: 3D domain-containing protein [Phycisphaeraceae bacterium]